MINTIIAIVIILGALAAIASWVNTQAIRKDLAAIKEKVGIEEEQRPSFLDKDLDKK